MKKYAVAIALILSLTVNIIYAQDNSTYIKEIIAENFKVLEKSSSIGLQSKIKTLKVAFLDKNISNKPTAIKESPNGFFINYDNSGLPTSYHKYRSIDDFFNNDFVATQDLINELTYSKKKIEKHINHQDNYTEMYDLNGNITEIQSKYNAEDIQETATDSTATLVAKDYITDFLVRKNKYNAQKKLIEQLDYQNTFDKNILQTYATTKFKYSPTGKIIKSEIVLESNKNIIPANNEIIEYKYNAFDKLASIVNKLQNISMIYKYSPTKELVSITTVSPALNKVAEFKKNLPSTTVYTDGLKNITTAIYAYTFDDKKNWTAATIKMTTVNNENKVLGEENYEILRTIEYY